MFAKTADFRKMKKINIPVFAIDFEGSRKIGVVEYGAARIEGGAVVGVETSLCAPKIPIPQRDSEFFGIKNSEAAKFPPFAEGVSRLRELRREGMFAAHNAAVEDSLLRDAMPSPGFVPDFSRGSQTAQWAPWIDTCALLKNIFPTAQSAKLSQAIEQFALAPELGRLAEKFCPPRRRKWHCAPFDALACALLLIKICSLDGFEGVSLAWLAKYSSPRYEGGDTLF